MNLEPRKFLISVMEALARDAAREPRGSMVASDAATNALAHQESRSLLRLAEEALFRRTVT